MKQCLLCGQTEPDDAATCRACGEASWSAAAPAPKAAPPPAAESAEPDTTDAPDAPRGLIRSKRGKR